MVLWQTRRENPDTKRTLLELAIALVVFGFSDVVEARTGAWWRPWWLFVWKAVCVIALVATLVNYFRIRKRLRSETSQEEGK